VETDIPLVDGNCTLVQPFLAIDEADQLLESLIDQTPWQQPEVTLFGKKIKSPRLAAWYGDPAATYTYSGLVNEPLPWTPVLSELKKKVEHHCNQPFNSVLLNYYRDGNDAMGWHADNEPELGPAPTIVSLSLGQSRRFLLKHKRNKNIPTTKIDLEHGSLLIMSGNTQRNWKHSISRTKRSVKERVNLTFRLIYPTTDKN
jgi:alkylated DNA repair dioxygenase AlkB